MLRFQLAADTFDLAGVFLFSGCPGIESALDTVYFAVVSFLQDALKASGQQIQLTLLVSSVFRIRRI